jgi:tetratricopeptide (TPR) repeat protein
LAGFYPLQLEISGALLLTAVVMLGGLSLMAIRMARRAPYFLTGWFWFLGTLVPVIGLVQVGVQAMADRYTYVPMIGVLIAGTWGIAETFKRRRASAQWLVAAAVALVVLSAVRAHAQVQQWKDSTAFWTRAATVAFAVGDFQAHMGIGRVLGDQGRNEEAHDHFVKAVNLNPDSAEARYFRGVAALRLGRVDEAMLSFEAAVRLQPDRAEAHQGLGLAFLAQQNPAAAVPPLAEAVRLQPGSAVIQNDLGWALVKSGRVSEGMTRFAEAIRLRPDLAGAHNNMGLAHAIEGRLTDALPSFAEAVRLDPSMEEARVNLARSLAGLGRIDEAKQELAEALRRNPNSVPARRLLDQLGGRRP